MSTRSPHGYRVKPGADPFDFIDRLRAVMGLARDAADAKLLAGLYSEAIDRVWFAER